MKTTSRFNRIIMGTALFLSIIMPTQAQQQMYQEISRDDYRALHAEARVHDPKPDDSTTISTTPIPAEECVESENTTFYFSESGTACMIERIMREVTEEVVYFVDTKECLHRTIEHITIYEIYNDC